jgi:hypothetical protein
MINKARATWLASLLAAALPAFAQPPAPTASPAPAAAAQNPAAGVPWSSLDPPQQQLLKKFADGWSTLPPARQ